MPVESNIHASCIAIGGKGVLLLGGSGAGKSDLALRLIDDGAALVADDRTLLFVKNGALHAKAPPSIKGLLEKGKIEVLAGANLPSLIKLIDIRAKLPLEQAVKDAIEAGRKYMRAGSADL